MKEEEAFIPSPAAVLAAAAFEAAVVEMVLSSGLKYWLLIAGRQTAETVALQLGPLCLELKVI